MVLQGACERQRNDSPVVDRHPGRPDQPSGILVGHPFTDWRPVPVPKIAIAIGIVLIVVGGWAYLSSGPGPSPTALIPAVFGVALAVAGLIGLRGAPARRQWL